MVGHGPAAVADQNRRILPIPVLRQCDRVGPRYDYGGVLSEIRILIVIPSIEQHRTLHSTMSVLWTPWVCACGLAEVSASCWKRRPRIWSGCCRFQCLGGLFFKQC